jgi:hypothetical protein
MIKALKVTMIVYGAVVILTGLPSIFLPDAWGGMHGMSGGPSYIMWMSALTGALSVTIGVWVIIGSLDPLRNINWVKFIIMWCILALVVHIYSITRGYVDVNQIIGFIIVHGIFAVAFLALYPWRKASNQ